MLRNVYAPKFPILFRSEIDGTSGPAASSSRVQTGSILHGTHENHDESITALYSLSNRRHGFTATSRELLRIITRESTITRNPSSSWNAKRPQNLIFTPYSEEDIEIAEQTRIPYGLNHFCSAVRLIQVRHVRPPRDNTVRADRGVAGEVMGLDMIKVHRGADAGHLV
jgi:hypothetical protein